MDQDIFPNPLVRNDLPVRRRRWPRLLVLFFVVVVLVVVFLPQILATSVGRKFAVTYIARKSKSAVVLESIKTSWFGSTTVKQLWIKDPMGRRMGCRSLVCKASLLDLLRGKWSLGDAQCEGLYVDYVINNGRGLDSFDMIGGVSPDDPPAGPPALAPLSGKIRISNGTLALWRGAVQPKLYDIAWESERFLNLSGTLNIDSLDQPWTFDLQAEQAEEGKPTGTVTCSGSIDLGESGRFDSRSMSFDVKFAGKNVYAGPLGASLIRGATSQDVRHALGDVLTTLNVAAKGAEGKIQFEKFEAEGPSARIDLKPVIDLTRVPAQLSLAGDKNRISMSIARPLATRGLAYLNPFFREAVAGQGQVHLSLEEFSVGLSAERWSAMTARGAISAKAVLLARLDEIAANQAIPENIASQLALLTGDIQPTVTLEADGRFIIGDTKVAIPPMSTRIGFLHMNLEGTTSLETGQISMIATVLPGPGLKSVIPSLGDALIAVPVGGTVQKPNLNLLASQGKLSAQTIKEIGEQISQQVARMRSAETHRLMQKSQQKVQDILQSIQGPTTAATKPKTDE